jgi:hypothetical protein
MAVEVALDHERGLGLRPSGGKPEGWRGAMHVMDPISKIKLGDHHPDIPVNQMLEANQVSGRCWRINDGRLFACPVEVLLRIRTGTGTKTPSQS